MLPTSPAELISNAELRAYARMYGSAPNADPVKASAALDQSLEDLRHYQGQHSAMLAALKRGFTYQPSHRTWSFYRDLTTFHTDGTADYRIRSHETEQHELATLEGRAVNSTALAGVVPPNYLLDHFSSGLRAAMPLGTAIGEEMPTETDSAGVGGGLVINIAKVTTNTTGASPATENAAPTITDPATTMVSVPVNTVEAQMQVSLQMLERGNMDLLISRELFGALNAETERQIIAGSGTNGQATGLLTAAGTSSVTYTNASPTAITAMPKVGATMTTSANAFGRGAPDIIATHPRFLYFLSAAGEVVDPPLDWQAVNPDASLIGSTAFPTNLGAGTNETRLVAFPRGAVYVGMSMPKVTTLVDVGGGSGSFTATIIARRYLAVGTIWPSAVAILSGTGMQAALS